MKQRSAKIDELNGIVAWEQGELDEDGTVELFQHLVDNGHAWQLQGVYGRTAKALIDAGLVRFPVMHDPHGAPGTGEDVD